MSIASCSETLCASWGPVWVELAAPAETMGRVAQLFGPWVTFRELSAEVGPVLRFEITGHGSGLPDAADPEPVRLHAAMRGSREHSHDRVIIRNHDIDSWYEISSGLLRLSYSGEPDVFDVCQVLRSVFVEAGTRAGGQLIHTAAIDIDGSGVLFTGPKGAGKTSSMLAFLRAGANFVTNDKALLLKGTIIGVPQAISASPWIRESLGGYPRHRSSRSAAGKELFYPCEMDPKPPTVAAAQARALIAVHARLNAATQLNPCPTEDIHAMADYIAHFDYELHGSWVSDLFEPAERQIDWLSELDVPWLELTFDPWNRSKATHCKSALMSLIARSQA